MPAAPDASRLIHRGDELVQASALHPSSPNVNDCGVVSILILVVCREMIVMCSVLGLIERDV
ncbi:hypothetical protein W02_09290 [Nitrospira sp. KM1]|nr:hypothetical protein W02_09290 [Nitrospira sp. KM1]